MKNKINSNIHDKISQTSRNQSSIILFALLTVIILTIGIMWPFISSFKLGILTQENRFNSEQFSKISESGITDNKGSILFIDSDLDVVYPKNSTAIITQNDLDNMLDVEMVSQEIEMFRYNNDDSEFTQIYSEGESTRTSWYVILDKDNNYVESENFYNIKTTYTDDDIDYILNDYVKDARDYKYFFVSENNNEFYMIVNLNQKIVLFEPYEILITTIFLLLIITLSFVLFKSPKKRLIRQLNRPIKDLSDAMSNFAPGKSAKIIQKYGITEYDSIVNTFNNMVSHINKLEELNNSLDKKRKDMFASIAHDLKTPITILTGYINAMNNEKIPKDNYKDYFNKILLKSEQLTALINEFAVYNEMNHSNFELKREMVDIYGFIRNYLANNYEYIDSNEFTLIVDIPEKRIDYSIDKIQFTRALDNLLSNFIKYNPKKTAIHVTTVKAKDLITIVLENNGNKISDKISKTLFDPFVIDDQSRNTSSTGLGLSITKLITELHNGKITYTTSEEYCNQFTIVFKI